MESSGLSNFSRKQDGAWMDYPMILEYRIKNNGFGIIANRMENSGLSKDIETRMENNL